ncbi:hypothetical protein ACFLYG_02170 [Chloroflexota bacterium]
MTTKVSRARWWSKMGLEQELAHQRNKILDGWQKCSDIVPSAYRVLAFVIATARIFAIPSAHYFVIPPPILVTGAGIYTLLKALHPFRWHERFILNRSLFGADIAVCIFLVILTGGLHSPFLLYTLAPVLTAALLLDGRVTFSIAALSGVYVIGSHLGNPFSPTQLSLPDISYFFGLHDSSLPNRRLALSD